MVHRWLSPRALLLHLLLIIVGPGCLFAGWWQVHRALSGNLLSYGYSVEWPAFAIIAGIAWWQLIHDGWHSEQSGPLEASSDPTGSMAAPLHPGSPVPAGGRRPAPTSSRRPWEPEPGTPEWDAFQADLADDLAERVPKTWSGRRAEPAHDESRS